MLFKTGFTVNRRGQPPMVITEPVLLEHYKDAIITPGQIRIAKLNRVIHGSYETKNPAEIKLLMKVGTLFFNPKEAVDEGIFTAGEMAAMGYPIPGAVVAPEEVKAPVVEELPEPLPDFDTLSKDSLVAWADAQDPPIHLDRRKRKSDLADEVRAALEERK